MSKPRPIFVLGVDRSGTSLVASTIYQWGAYGGDREWLTKGDPNNPAGYYENKTMQAFRYRLASGLDVSFWQDSFEDVLLEKAQDPEIRPKAQKAIATMNEHSSVWFWKEPLLGIELPFWLNLLEEMELEPTFVITLRNPYDSAVSWQRFILPPAFQGKFQLIAANLLRWQYFLRSILIHTNRFRHRRIFVPYEDLLKSPREQCQRISGFLDAQVGEALETLPEDRVERMAQQIQPKLQRNKSDIPFDQRPEATEGQKAFYRFLLQAAETPNVEFDSKEFPMYAGWKEYLGNITQFMFFYQETVRSSLKYRILSFLEGILRRARFFLKKLRP